jgi:signal transduction histidine kinase
MNFLRRIINNLSIKQKLIGLSMVTSTIATIITCGVFIVFSIAAERTDLVDEIRLVGKIFSEELSEYVADKNKKQILNSLHTLKNRQLLIQACVYTDLESSDFVYFFNDKKRSKSCSQVPPAKSKYEFRSDEVSGEHLVVSYYITNKNKKIGYVTIVANLDRIEDRVNRGLFTSLVLFAIILSISYIISRFLQKTISKPILHLANVSYVVRGGDYSIRATHYSNDEVGVLTEAFNNMLQEIQYAKEHLEEKVIERTRDLEKVMQVKVQFLSNMSHEIRTPIHGILNYIDFLIEDWKSLNEEQRYGFVKKLHNNSVRLLSLINNLLDLSKFDAGKMEFCMQKDNLLAVVEGVIDECEALYVQNTDISMEFNYDKALTYSAVFDQERIAQVIRNLLSNAIKFTPKGKIKIALEAVKFKKENGSKVQAFEVSISDEGVGIPSDELEYIFDKFNQSATTKTGAGGTGLGLTISQEIIKAHQGTIWAANNENNIGAVFKFIIPVHQSKLKEA